jgi:hypothetical protein
MVKGRYGGGRREGWVKIKGEGRLAFGWGWMGKVGHQV